jgi:mono/diheme cytochrome c family protein
MAHHNLTPDARASAHSGPDPRPGPGPAPRRVASRAFLVAAAAIISLIAPGCRQEMYNQPKYKTLATSSFFRNGAASRPIPEHTIARGHLDDDSLLNTGKVDGAAVDEFPFAITKSDLIRGQQRYRIYCLPCHGERGDGKGMIVQRGFPPPPPFYGKVAPTQTSPVPTYGDLRQAPVGHFFDVMTNGHGTMYSYAARINVEDRWRIASYIRVLQLSQGATPEDLKSIPDPNAREKALLQEASQ